MAFYEAKIKDMGMTINLTGASAAGGLVAGADEGGQRTLNVMVGGSGGETSITVTYGRKR
jgi:hypothetical protein